MSLLSPTEIKAQVPTSLADETIQEIIESEESEMVRRLGPHEGSVVEQVTGWHRSVFVSRRISSVTSVAEAADSEDTPETLDASEYRVVKDEGRIDRQGGKFLEYVTVTYLPVSDVWQRRQGLVDLVRLAMARQALAQESVGQGDYMYKAPDWEREREAIFGRLKTWVSV